MNESAPTTFRANLAKRAELAELTEAQLRVKNSPLTKTLEQYWLDQKEILEKVEREAHDLRSNCEILTE